jgi:hypothetical protein
VTTVCTFAYSFVPISPFSSILFCRLPVKK